MSFNDRSKRVLNKQLETYRDTLDSYREDVSQSTVESADEITEIIDNMKSATAPEAIEDAPEGMMIAQLRGVLKMSELSNADITRELAEVSAQDGGDIVLLTRITPYQLAGIRAVAKMAGSYEKALHVVMDSFGGTGG